MIRAALLLALGLTPPQETVLRVALLQEDVSLLRTAELLYLQSRYREAESLYRRSYELEQTIYGAASLQAAYGLVRLSTVYHAARKLAEAETAARQAVHLFETVSGPASPDTALGLANLAVALAEQGQLVRAEPLLRRSAFLIRKISLDSPALTPIEENLALVHIRLGELAKAELLLRSILAGFDSKGEPPPATTLAILAELSIAERNWEVAGTAVEEAYQRRSVGEYAWLSGVLRLRAAVEAHNGDFRQAAQDMKQAIHLLDLTNGSESAVMRDFLRDYSLVLKRLGNWKEARRARLRADEISRRSLTAR